MAGPEMEAGRQAGSLPYGSSLQDCRGQRLRVQQRAWQGFVAWPCVASTLIQGQGLKERRSSRPVQTGQDPADLGIDRR
ncbi:hypothetical protein ON010_g9839 [Phytophthora cinnamomi]|nr:hypothetical protein ON010_g9839 [Phytophthora cinnamomi]